MLIRNIGWSVFGRLSILSFHFLFNILFARFYGPTDFGAYQFIVSIVNILNILLAFGMPNILIREFSNPHRTANSMITTVFLFRVTVSLIVLITVLLISALTGFSERKYLLILSLSLLTSAMNFLQFYLFAEMRNKENTLLEILKMIVFTSLRIIIIVRRFDLLYLYILYVLESLFYGSSLLIYSKSRLQLKFQKPSASTLIFLIKESFPLLISGLAIVLYNEIDKVMIQNLLGSFYVGQYSAASKIVLLYSLILHGLNQALLPYFVKLKRKDHNLYIKYIKIYMDLTLWLTIVSLLLIFFYTATMIQFLYGQEYKEAESVFKLLLLKGLFSVMFITSGTYMIIENIQKKAYLRNLAGLLINIILNAFLIPRYGIRGAATATAVSMFFSSYFAHLFISGYRTVFKQQTESFFKGFASFKYIYLFLKHRSLDDNNNY